MSTTIKVLLIGDAGVGKTSLMQRLVDDTFETNTQSTIGVDFAILQQTVEGRSIKVVLWDTAGQERFRTLTSSYYRGSHAMMMVYDVVRPDTTEGLGRWMEEARRNGVDPERCVSLLVGTKVDEPRKVSTEEGQALARQHTKGRFVETSAKHPQASLQRAFAELVEAAVWSSRSAATTPPASKPRLGRNQLPTMRHCCG